MAIIYVRTNAIKSWHISLWCPEVAPTKYVCALGPHVDAAEFHECSCSSPIVSSDIDIKGKIHYTEKQFRSKANMQAVPRLREIEPGIICCIAVAKFSKCRGDWHVRQFNMLAVPFGCVHFPYPPNIISKNDNGLVGMIYWYCKQLDNNGDNKDRLWSFPKKM